MTAPVRWPLHPRPSDGEALSSWMTRVAESLEIRIDELLADHLGSYTYDIYADRDRGIDINPPRELLVALAQRTGRSRDELWGMSVAGNVPWLLDTLEPSDDRNAYLTYARQHHVLLPARERPVRRAPGWRAWLPRHPLRRTCPTCADDPDRIPGRTLLSQLPLTLSCPRHGCYLEPIYGANGTDTFWANDNHAPRAAPPRVRIMDQRTHDALRAGVVHLPRRDVHAGVWFRLLRAIIDELDTSATQARTHADTLRHVWASIDHPPRGGLNTWRPFEMLDWRLQQRFLEATAAAIASIEDGTISAAGADSALFLPEPHRPVPDGSRPLPARAAARTKAEPFDYWKAAIDSMYEVIALARTNPAEAETLFRFLASSKVGPAVARRSLADVGITEYPSSHNPREARSGVIE